jgi:1-pyrroline-5-carboxylate dehydrogenase
MSDGTYRYPTPLNETVKSYAPGSPERAELVAALEACAAEHVDIPAVIGGEHIRSGVTTSVVMPHAHGHELARVHHASGAHVTQAIERGLAAQRGWAALPFAERAAVFLRAAELLAGPWRQRMNAACMLGQSKTAHQSEIDAVCELVDFFRFNVDYARRLHEEQPLSPPGTWNRAEYRPLEGFVLAITPFNFSSIGVNLACAPALLGNVVLWKPAHTAALAAWRAMELLREAGLPDGVISLIPGDGPEQGTAALASPYLAGIHFTGSTRTFRALWRSVGENLEHYRSFPRLVGETGGKDFLIAHPSADLPSLATAILRGGYEYQGQKCSALSRVYVPRSLWPALRTRLVEGLAAMKMGDVRDFSNFLGAVIDRPAFERIRGYTELARTTGNVLYGATCDDREGYFVTPTLVEVTDPHHRLMEEEIFGPVVTAYVYDDARYSDTLALIDATSPYALTGAVFARDRAAIEEAHRALRQAAGNFYVNDKPTGAVVGQQPFGGARASGTNDKAGAMWNLLRWTSPRTIKETFVPPVDVRYPFMG